MLCSICKKNVAIIFVNKIDTKNPDKNDEKNKSQGLCLDCAKKQGIDPMKAMMNQMGKYSNKDLENMAKQFDGLMEGMDFSEFDPEEMMGGMSSMLGIVSEDSDEENYDTEEVENFATTNRDYEKANIGSKTSVKTKTEKKRKKTKYLDQFGTNLTEKAKRNEIDKVIGREKELDRVIQILNRRQKNNPALIGEPGVGKTAITNALAIAVASGNVPSKLINKEVYLIDMTSMVAGTQFRGQFEARMKGLIDECASLGNIIVVIDELHTIVGGLEHDNSLNAANILKPALSSGKIQVIGTTTLKEYKKYIEKDSALERRFQPVTVDEPNTEDTIKIISGIKGYYEDYHNVKISDEMIKKAVEMSTKYIHDRFLPDKAIDLIDESCSRVNLNNITLSKIEGLNQKLKDIETEREIVVQDDSVEGYEAAAKLKADECAINTELERLKKKLKYPELSIDDLAGVVELWTKIPVKRLTTEESTKILSLEDNLKKRIIGQDQAIKAVSSAIIRKRANLKNVDKPPSFIFVGPTGVGKTELVKTLALELFDSKNNIIKLDMSEYMESHSVSKLIGSPPGYVGYDEAGQLTEKVRRNPYSIILFDEIEKAHQSVSNMLLQILDEGKLTDSQGRAVSFKHSIIVLTSNLGTNFKNESYGFANAENENTVINNNVMSSLKEFFSPEFLNRIDDVIVFNKLSNDNLVKIVDIMLNEFKTQIASKNITLEFTDELKKFVIQKGFDPKFGARPLKRAIEKNVEDVIATEYIKGIITEDSSHIIDYDGINVIIK